MADQGATRQRLDLRQGLRGHAEEGLDHRAGRRRAHRSVPDRRSAGGPVPFDKGKRMNLHYPTCATWVTNSVADCTCSGQRPWRIRKNPDELFPWGVYRRTGTVQDSVVYERLMS